MKRSSTKSIVACLTAVIAVACALTVNPSAALAESQTQVVKSSWTNIVNIDPADSEYGKHYGWRIVSAVSVTDGVISDVVVTGRGTGNPEVPATEKPYFEPCHFIMEERIIDASIDASKPNTVDAVDIVSGATHTSYAIKEATKEALGTWADNVKQAASVTEAINAIPNASDKAAAVSKAREAFNALPDAANYIPANVVAILTNAEAEAAKTDDDTGKTDDTGKDEQETPKADDKAKEEAAAEANIENGTITLAKTKYTYNGKAFEPAVTVKTKGGVTLSSNNYTIAYSKNKNAGKATVTVTAKAPYTGKKTATFTIAKAAQTIKPAQALYSVKYNKKKAQTLKVAFKANGGGKVTYAAAKSGKVSLAKNGKVKIAKGAAKKTYTLKVKVTAAAKGNYAKTTKTVKLKIKVAASAKSKTQSLKAATL